MRPDVRSDHDVRLEGPRMTNSLRQKLGLKAASCAILLGYLLLAATPLYAQEVPGGEAVAALYYFMLGVALIIYIYFAITLQAIARKTGTGDAWWAWVPIMNLLLLAKIAKKEVWWGLLCLIPLVGIVFAIILMMGVAEARNKPNWWGILMIVPVANFVVPGYLAWAD